MSSCANCEEDTVKIPLGIFVPIRGTAQTTHGDATFQTLASFTLPQDDLAQSLMISIMGKDSTGAVRTAFQIPALVSRRSGDAPDYSAQVGSISAMNSEDIDLDAHIIANSDTNILIQVRDFGGDAGVLDWDYSIWVWNEMGL